jgi:hypothetical protein
MLLFWSEGHVEKWRKAWNQAPGESFSLEQCWKLAHAWYSPDRRAPDWRRRTVAEAEALFASLGLTSPFWSLR